MKDIKVVGSLAGCLEQGAREVCENLHTCESCDKLPDRCWWNTEKQCQEKQTTGINSSLPNIEADLEPSQLKAI